MQRARFAKYEGLGNGEYTSNHAIGSFVASVALKAFTPGVVCLHQVENVVTDRRISLVCWSSTFRDKMDNGKVVTEVEERQSPRI